MRALASLSPLLLLLAACDPSPAEVDAGPVDSGPVDSGPLDAGPVDSGPPPPGAFVVVTFNSGTTMGLAQEEPPVDGYGDAQAAFSDMYYGDGLAWLEVIDATRAFFAAHAPAVAVFQEIFDPRGAEGCAAVPEEARAGFLCERWAEGDPTVLEELLGPGYQLACHPGKPDKCVAVRLDFGAFRGCEAGAPGYCDGALAGFGVAGCGSGARVARGVIERAEGAPLTVVSVHGTSGVSAEDRACRVAQIEQVFLDLGDGAPGVSGSLHLVLGDLNTDPGRFASIDESAARWNDFVGPDRALRYLTPIGDDAPGSYAGAFDIDHVMSDGLRGSCRHPGLAPGLPPVYEGVYFDHRPVLCRVYP